MIDTSDEKFQNSPGLQRWAAPRNLKIAAQAIHKAQSAFSGAAEAMGISSEEDVPALVDEVRYGKER